MSTLLIKHAKTVDGSSIDILIDGNKIIKTGQLSDVNAEKIIDLKGEHYVSAGWIDAHTHCFSKSPIYSDEPDLVGVAAGVTTVIDAGSAGALDIDTFYELTRKSKTNVFSFLNISKIGLLRQNELADMNDIDSDAFFTAYRNHNDFIIGMKARMSKSVVGENGIAPLLKAKEMQKTCHLPLMVHVGNNPPNLDEIADVLTKGDIITHCFNGKPNCILEKNGQLKESIKRALARGVILDVGHGGESFSFSVAEQAMRIGTYPDIISSDIYSRNRIEGPVYSLAHVMTKFLCMGFTLKQVIDCVTEKAATLLNIENKGFIKDGFDADLTIFDIKNEKMTLTDADGAVRETSKRIVPVTTIIAGQIYHIENAV